MPQSTQAVTILMTLYVSCHTYGATCIVEVEQVVQAHPVRFFHIHIYLILVTERKYKNPSIRSSICRYIEYLRTLKVLENQTSVGS